MTALEKPGTLPSPGVIGRTLRIVLGLGLFFLLFLAPSKFGPDADLSLIEVILLVAAGLWGLPELVKPALGEKWALRALVGFAALVVALVGVDFYLYQDFWGPPLGWLLLIMVEIMIACVSLSFFVQAIFATPG